MPETWRQIPGYEGRYDVSDQGRVRSWVRHLNPPYMMKPQKRPDGYLQFMLRGWDGKSRSRKIHTLVMLAFVGPRPDGMEVRHLDGEGINNRLPNLRYGTHAENMQDSVGHGRSFWANKTHCPQGHPYDESNTARWGNTGPKRDCRTCHAARKRQRRALAS